MSTVCAVVHLDRIEIVAKLLFRAPGFRVESDVIEVPDGATEPRVVDLQDARRIPFARLREDLPHGRVAKRWNGRSRIGENIEVTDARPRGRDFDARHAGELTAQIEGFEGRLVIS